MARLLYRKTPFKADFIDYMECEIPVKDITKVKIVIVIGKITHKYWINKGYGFYPPCVSYHIKKADTGLFSTKNYNHTQGGKSIIYGDRVDMHLIGHELVIPIDRKQ